MLASMVEVFGEAFAVTRKAGVDHHRFLEVMNDLFGSAIYRNYGAIIADEKFRPAGFPLKLGFKDMRLVLEAAQELAAPMPFASTIRDNYLAAIAAGQQEWDWASVAMVAARNAGLEIVAKGEV
jgi:3-hydroxyisobutyrate dehydrogenase-like beta-hydroxyacid dehydrogenase